RLCQTGTKPLFHLFISCPLKLNFWFSILPRYSLTDKFLNADEIWSVLTFFFQVDEKNTVDIDVLSFFGSGIDTLWRHRRSCVIDDTPWHTTTVVSIFELDHSNFLSSLHFERN
ncbi:hypothetical protein BCV72DRAFT_199385, partial [Rhizopus microsporus var. microsporus]